MDWLSRIVAFLPWIALTLVSVLLTAVRLPGTWLMAAVTAGYAWWTQWEVIPLWVVLVLVGIASVGEVVEQLTSVFTARRAGASRQAAWGGLIGGFLGMIFLSFLVPIPVIGTVIGALVGCFAGAMITELAVKPEIVASARVGAFSALGFVLGMVTKLALAMAMAGILLATVLMHGTSPQAAPDEHTASRGHRPTHYEASTYGTTPSFGLANGG